MRPGNRGSSVARPDCGVLQLWMFEMVIYVTFAVRNPFRRLKRVFKIDGELCPAEWATYDVTQPNCANIAVSLNLTCRLSLHYYILQGLGSSRDRKLFVLPQTDPEVDSISRLLIQTTVHPTPSSNPHDRRDSVVRQRTNGFRGVESACLV